MVSNSRKDQILSLEYNHPENIIVVGINYQSVLTFNVFFKYSARELVSSFSFSFTATEPGTYPRKIIR